MFDFQRVQNLKTAISKRKKIVPCSSEGSVPRQGRDSWGTFQLESGSLLKKQGVEREKLRFAAWKWDLRMKNWVYLTEASKINSWAKAYEKKQEKGNLQGKNITDLFPSQQEVSTAITHWFQPYINTLGN